jgi:hypothetical protein
LLFLNLVTRIHFGGTFLLQKYFDLSAENRVI